MPNKNCPTCKKEYPVRTAKCSCGYVFYTPVRRTKAEIKAKVEKVEVIEVKESPAPIQVVKVNSDEVLKENALALGFTFKSKKLIYKFMENHKYYAVVSSTNKITGIQRDCL